MRLMIHGIPSKPFSVSTLPPPVFEKDEKRVATIRRLSRERYAERCDDVEEKIAKWIASGRAAKKTAKASEKTKEKEEEELKKAKKKGMTLAAYRVWRDRELWTNEYNALRKKKLLGEALTGDEEKAFIEYEKKLTASGGIPPPSKGLTQLLEAKK